MSVARAVLWAVVIVVLFIQAVVAAVLVINFITTYTTLL